MSGASRVKALHGEVLMQVATVEFAAATLWWVASAEWDLPNDPEQRAVRDVTVLERIIGWMQQVGEKAHPPLLVEIVRARVEVVDEGGRVCARSRRESTCYRTVLAVPTTRILSIVEERVVNHELVRLVFHSVFDVCGRECFSTRRMTIFYGVFATYSIYCFISTSFIVLHGERVFMSAADRHQTQVYAGGDALGAERGRAGRRAMLQHMCVGAIAAVMLNNSSTSAMVDALHAPLPVDPDPDAKPDVRAPTTGWQMLGVVTAQLARSRCECPVLCVCVLVPHRVCWSVRETFSWFMRVVWKGLSERESRSHGRRLPELT